MSFGDAANSAPPLFWWFIPRDPAGTAAQQSAFDRHNNKGGNRITIILRRPKLIDILLAAIFPSPCVLAARLELLGQEHELFGKYYTYFKRARQDCKS